MVVVCCNYKVRSREVKAGCQPKASVLDSIDPTALNTISSDHEPSRVSASDEDFTEAHYRQLLCAAKSSYRFATYDEIPWGTRFVLWRHDIDSSINRAAALADIEAEEGVTTTYFVNPCSEFYNPFEPRQSSLIKHIIGLGHRLGLHFDATFHDIQDEEQLHCKVAQERRWLEDAFGVRPAVFSFHNPSAAHLHYDADSYGDVISCYSRRFKVEVPYCSDSNGYWRFRRLLDVFSEATDTCLQVLTHPEWWQKQPMPPRQRIFRCAYGRAEATMRDYDDGLRANGRLNHAGLTDSLFFLQPLHTRLFEMYDYLCNGGHLAALFVELWRLHERQINQFCKAVFRKDWQVPAADINAFFEHRSLAIDGLCLFNAVFGSTWQQVARVDCGQYKDWVVLRNSLIHGRSTAPAEKLEEGCVFLCRAIEALAAWGQSQPMAYDGISHLGSIGIPTYKTADGSLTDLLEEIADEVPGFPGNRWERFKADMQKVGAGEAAE